MYSSDGKQLELMGSAKNSAFSERGRLLFDEGNQHILSGRGLLSEIAVSLKERNIEVILV